MTTPIKVLLIDDDPAVLSSMRRMFRILGWDVTTRSDALGASHEIRCIAPDVVLIDVDMPALSGDRLAQILSSGRCDGRPQVLLFSGLPEEELRIRAIRANADGWVRKDMSVPEIVEQVRKAAQRVQPRRDTEPVPIPRRKSSMAFKAVRSPSVAPSSDR